MRFESASPDAPPVRCLRVGQDEIPALSAGEIHVWAFDVAAPAAVEDGYLSQFLSADERDRALRLEGDSRRSAFLRTRFTLRSVLASYLGSRAENLRFVYGSSGKPELEARELRFSLTHSAESRLLGVTRSAEIGVDLERVRPVGHAEAVARRFFSDAERAALDKLAEGSARELFFRFWTVKEAFAKARGGGIFRDASVARTRFSANGVLAWEDGSELRRGWSLHELRQVAGFAGALVCRIGASV